MLCGIESNSCVVRLFALLVSVAATLTNTARCQEKASDEFPRELVEFVTYEHNPVFASRGIGFWDERIRERGWIIKEESLWRMWYTGYQPSGPMKLGYATSPDGLAWTRHGDGPIYDKDWVEDMMIVRQGAKYYMFAEGLHDRTHLLVSDDGIQWTREGTLDMRRVNGEPISEGPYGTPTARFDNGLWQLFYERGDLGVWLATSSDMKRWTNVQDEPVLSPGPGEYDRKQIALNQIIPYGGRFYAYYHGQGESGTGWTTNIAVSTDLKTWTKYSKNPLFAVVANKSSGIVVHDGKAFRLYTMHNQVHVHSSSPSPK